MIKRTYLRNAVAAAFVVASGISNSAFGVAETDQPNDSISSAQPLTIGTEGCGVVTVGCVVVTGAIGYTTGTARIGDVDFYSFQGKAGDRLNVDIDDGIKASTTLLSVDTVVAVFGPLPSTAILRQMNDGSPIDTLGSIHTQDARIDNLVLPSDGTYVVGVSSHPRTFVPGGGLSSSLLGARSNGSYILILSGVTPTAPLVQYINIEVKPGSGEIAPINPKSKGNIPVALLSAAATPNSPAFDALKVKVDRDSLTFGRTGGEKSLLRCGKEGTDVDGDGLLDLVCHFDNQAADFTPESLEGTVKGLVTDKSEEGRPFEGSAFLKVVPGKHN